ncbi:MAG: uroporphyrinogen-III C-methyltransferase [Nitrospirae bacterium]|nr:uroporphyrinogen-III C-methyltransferase [Nitrospirota bacterium]
MKTGKVFLVGAGPGDPKLITIKGMEAIKEADLIVYDYLANKSLLSHGKEGAEIVYVGKMGGRHTLSQEKINELIVKRAKKGKVVARLKGGDPFIFGRGGEEAEELAEAGIPFEIIPGVTAAIACPAYAGIPLTHRDYTSTVAFITGHEDPTKEDSSIAWEKISTGAGTLVFLMGMSNLPEIVKNLQRCGRDPMTPVALIRWGTRPDQKTVVGTLGDIIDKAKKHALAPPVIIVVGEVVNLRKRLNWFEGKPLFGRKIIVTRAREQASDFVELLYLNGAEPIEFPTIQVIPPDSWDELDKAVDEIRGFEWIIFTSINGVRFFFERLNRKGDLRLLYGIKICAIGPQTASEIQRYGLAPDLIPKEYRAEAIIEEMGREDIAGKRMLLPRAEIAREILPQELSRMGARIKVVTAYKTIKPEEDLERVRELLKNKEISVITFTSSSTVKNFLEMFNKGEVMGLIDGTAVACIGPITAKTAEDLGIRTDIMPSKYTMPELTEAIVTYFSKRGI